MKIEIFVTAKGGVDMGVGAPILIALGVLPTLFIFWRIYKSAPVKKVPFGKLLKVFGISMLSTIPAIILELIGGGILGAFFPQTSHIYLFLNCIFVIALSEEGCKYFSFKWMIFNDRQFSNTYDGLFYGAAAALGFATLENILYIFQHGIGTAFLRMFLSVPGHASTGIFMGYYFGISKYKKYNNIHDDVNPQRRAYAISVLLHGLFDFFLFNMGVSSDTGIILNFLGFVVIMIIEYVVMIKTVRRGKRECFNIYNRYYYEKMNGAAQDMIGQTNEHLVEMPAYNYNSVPMGVNNNFAGAPMPPNMAPVGMGQPFGSMPPQGMNRPPMGQPVNGMPPQGMNRPPMDQPVNAMPPQGMNRSPMDQPVNAMPPQGMNRPPMGQPFNAMPPQGMNRPPMGQPVNAMPPQGMNRPPMVQPVNAMPPQGMNRPPMGQPVPPQPQNNTHGFMEEVTVPDISSYDEAEEAKKREAYLNQLHRPVSRQIDVVFDEPAEPVCPQCGTKCEKGAKFCIICGTKL